MLTRLKLLNSQYPGQFWLLFWGNFIVSIGNSMTWPFLTIYIRQTFNLPLTVVASILTIRSVTGLLAAFIAGPAADRFGRKWILVVSLAFTGLSYLLMAQAKTVPAWIIIMALYGAFHPIFRVGADAMIADIIPVENRLSAYSLLRIISNLGIALGPIIGGFLVAVSYARAFTGGALVLLFFMVVSFIFVRETLHLTDVNTTSNSTYGYSAIIKDRQFVTFILVLTSTIVGAIMMFVLLPVYIKEQFGLAENYFGWIIATNGLMIVLLQYPISRLVKGFRNFSVLISGSIFYAIGLGSVAFGTNFPMFVGSMAIMTIGEILMMPTATTLAANMAPPDMRGRYMGLFNLTYTISMGIGPIVGGLLSDLIAPVAIWYGGMVFGLLSTLGFIYMVKKYPALNKKVT